MFSLVCAFHTPHTFTSLTFRLLLPLIRSYVELIYPTMTTLTLSYRAILFYFTFLDLHSPAPVFALTLARTLSLSFSLFLTHTHTQSFSDALSLRVLPYFFIFFPVSRNQLVGHSTVNMDRKNEKGICPQWTNCDK